MNGLRLTRCALVWLVFILAYNRLEAQTNSWNSATSGNWEDATWSLGLPPGAGQTVLITNHAWKAVSIGSATASNFPQTMTVDALSVTSPGTDTVNTVLFNYAGFQTPFVTQSLSVSNDARVVVLGSALNVQYGKLLVDAGSVLQDAASQVSAGSLQVQNGGLFDLADGTLAVTNGGRESIIGGQFHQEGGSNVCRAFLDQGEYDLSNGDLVALGGLTFTTLQINDSFLQSGGTVDGVMGVGQSGTASGSYQMSGGTIRSAVLFLPAPSDGGNSDISYFVQTGGTNYSTNLDVGSIHVQISDWPTLGWGYYTLSNGLVVTSSMAVNGRGGFTQWGGVHTNGSLALTETALFEQQQPGAPSYFIYVDGYYQLNGGTFISDALTATQGNFSQTGGSAQIGTIQMTGGQCSLSGGQLTVSNIDLSGGASFTQTGGTLTQSGTLTLQEANLLAGAGSQQFGKLLLAGGNCTLTFPAENCALYFVGSTSLGWSNASTLTVSNWNGALFGGGSQRLHFGYDNTGLASQQVSQIQFINPVGLSSGTYPARILSSGEVVPVSNQGQGTGSGTANSWISQTGGNWDDASSWSLGVTPNNSQDVFFTNAYWKAVTIDSSTVSSVPESLAVKSLTITSVSPTNGVFTTQNTLLLNYAQPGNPLVIGTDTNAPGSLLVDSNSTMALFYSGLVVNDALGQSNSPIGNFQVDGNFIQSDNSEVVAGFLDLNGTYTLTNGGQLYVGTQFINGTFNQRGGTNTGAIVAGTNGTYNLFDGAFNGDITLYPGHFVQWGGTVSANLAFNAPSSVGVYLLMGGLLQPGALNLGAVPITNYDVLPSGVFEQGGGTNNPTSLTIGLGTYYLSNGVLNASSLMLTTNMWAGSLGAGNLEQYGGYVTNTSLVLNGGTNTTQKQIQISPAKYNLYNGILDSPSLAMNVADFSLSTYYFHATNRVGTLSMSASIYQMNPQGLLQVDELQVTNGSQFWHQGGALSGARNVTLANGEWAESTTATQLGQLKLLSGTNSTIYLGGSSVLQFADSGGVPWASDGLLTINLWSGSLSGNGAAQILFGASASGLTAQQLSQVLFVNPVGLPNGIYGAKILSTGELVPDGNASTTGPVNFWINPGSGNWDDASSWSLGVLPNSSQSALIVNTNWKAVAINPATPVNFPASMTVSNLFIEGYTNTENTLLLNNFGTNVPLTVLNSLLLQNGAHILDSNSGLVLQGPAEITNSDIVLDGGFIRATNAGMTLSGSQFYVSNGVFEANSVSLGFPVPSRLNQYGGMVNIGNVGLTSYEFGTNDSGISLYGGILELPGGMDMLGGVPQLSYLQSGGTNYTAQITMEAGYGGRDPIFTLNGGLLCDTGITVLAGPTINQNGGTHVVTNTISLIGESIHGLTPLPATYNLSGGTLSAATISLNADQGTAIFNQTNANAYVGEFRGFSESFESYWGAQINLSGGTLACSNLDFTESSTITQTGGALVVSNTLTIAGFIQPGPKIYSKYYFTAGTLSASNINMGGNWIIGDSAGTNRITNSGTCTLSNSLSIGNAVEQLGRFILGDSSTIDLSGASSRLSFANSSGEVWTGGATLIVSDWNGSASGGGAEQLKFGADQSGLTAAQLNQIRFRISTNLYSAKILNTGEVVPDQQVAPQLAFTQQGNQLILSWLPGYRLQSSPNPAGPFQDVFFPFFQTPPPYLYTNSMDQPQQFFRIVPQ